MGGSSLQKRRRRDDTFSLPWAWEQNVMVGTMECGLLAEFDWGGHQKTLAHLVGLL